jgi:lipoate synthase
MSDDLEGLGKAAEELGRTHGVQTLTLAKLLEMRDQLRANAAKEPMATRVNPQFLQAAIEKMGSIEAVEEWFRERGLELICEDALAPGTAIIG